jgi:nicotinamide mononucleotide transporter
MQHIINWIILHYQEIAGTTISIIYLVLSIHQNKWLWPFGLISSAIYVVVFYKSGIYADMGLQVYYVFISIYGWYSWKNLENKTEVDSKVFRIILKPGKVFILVIITGILFFGISQALIRFTNSTVPFIDAFTTALSIAATWMLARKYIEHWIIWIVVDILSAGLYVYKELFITVFLYLVYSIFAVVGFYMWKKTLQRNLVQVQS